MSKLRIGIIGAGASGMTATKACLEEGFDVVVYEKTNFTGGLWRYHDEDIDGIGSVMESTITNSSKEMSAFSDFPPPPEFPNHLHNTKMVNKFYFF
jgi:dimethylaniline monooxygenase (N-oxide forming)